MIINMLTYLKQRRSGAQNSAFEARSPQPEPPVTLDYADIESKFDKRSFLTGEQHSYLEEHNFHLRHWLGSIDYSGQQREASLRYLISNYQPGDENRILLRLTDWVAPIQRLAAAWVFDNLHELSLEQLNAQYRLLLYLSRKERLAGSHVLKVIHQHLLSKAEQADQRSFFALNNLLRRLVYTLADLPTSCLRQRIGQDKDPFNRILLLSKVPAQELTTQEWEALASDASTFVKRRLVDFKRRHQLPLSREDLICLCLDPNRGLRELGRFYLNKDYGDDPYQLYRQQTGAERYYLADFARREDLELFSDGFSNHPAKRIKVLCFKALCACDSTLIENFSITTLLAQTKQIRQLACYHLARSWSLAQLFEARTAIEAHNPPRGRMLFLEMLYVQHKWHFIAAALQILLDDEDPQVEELIVRHVVRNTYLPQLRDQQLRSRIDHLCHQAATKSTNHPVLKLLLDQLELMLK